MLNNQAFQSYARRREQVANALAEQDEAALLITDLKNIRYLTGFSGSNAVLLLRKDATGTLATDGRYDTQIRLETGEPQSLDIRVANDAMAAAVQDAGAFAVEPSLGVATAMQLFGEQQPRVLSGLVERARLIKVPEEQQHLLAAGAIADGVWEQFVLDGVIQAGKTEREVAAELEFRLRSAGADGLSFDTILASGVNAAKPHAGVSGDAIVPGLVTFDFGVYLNGYASDQTRTVCVGTPSARDAEIYDVVYRAQRAGEAVLRPGVALVDVDRACRDVIEAAGYGEFFIHSTGHGVGLDVHEAPRAAQTTPADVTLEAGMTLTVEPGIYLPGETGLRIENTYIITDNGATSCQNSSTELIVL